MSNGWDPTDEQGNFKNEILQWIDRGGANLNAGVEAFPVGRRPVQGIPQAGRRSGGTTLALICIVTVGLCLVSILISLNSGRSRSRQPLPPTGNVAHVSAPDDSNNSLLAQGSETATLGMLDESGSQQTDPVLPSEPSELQDEVAHDSSSEFDTSSPSNPTSDSDEDGGSSNHEPLQEALNEGPGHRFKAPEVVAKQSPDYPEMLKGMRIQGDVDVIVYLHASGVVRQVEVLHSSHPFLTRIAVEAASRWRFLPARLNGREIASHYPIRFRFVLR